jgi:hypothetical protein
VRPMAHARLITVIQDRLNKNLQHLAAPVLSSSHPFQRRQQDAILNPTGAFFPAPVG